MYNNFVVGMLNCSDTACNGTLPRNHTNNSKDQDHLYTKLYFKVNTTKDTGLQGSMVINISEF
jgi:hypothetical protein